MAINIPAEACSRLNLSDLASECEQVRTIMQERWDSAAFRCIPCVPELEAMFLIVFVSLNPPEIRVSAKVWSRDSTCQRTRTQCLPPCVILPRLTFHRP